MKLIAKLSPKHLFGSKKYRSVSRSDPPSFSSGSSSSSEGLGSSSSNLKAGSSTPTTVLRTDFSADIHVDLVQAFRFMDKDGDGFINRRELETLLNRVGADPLSEQDINLMLTDVDHDGEESISLEKFSEMSSCLGPACDDEIRDTFDFFDVDRDGKISAEELLGVFIAIGDDGCTLEDCKRMIAGVDSDGDGFVCFEDFSRMMMVHQRC